MANSAAIVRGRADAAAFARDSKRADFIRNFISNESKGSDGDDEHKLLTSEQQAAIDGIRIDEKERAERFAIKPNRENTIWRESGFIGEFADAYIEVPTCPCSVEARFVVESLADL